MNLNGINLNLLIVLDAVINEKSITRAAKRLNLSQPAVSQMLKQLRVILDDDLIMRGPFNNMILSKKAKDLKEPLKKILKEISEVFAEVKYFDPEYDKHLYNVGMTDIAATLFLPEIVKHIYKFSSNIRIKVKNILDITSYEDFINNGLDLAIGNYSVSSQNISSEKLFSSELVCIAWKEHPAFTNKQISLENFLEYPHLQVIYRDDFNELFNTILKQKSGKEREMIITVPDIMVALHSLKGSNCLCIGHKILTERYQKILELDYRPLPFETPLMEYSLYWKKEDENNMPLKWMRDTIAKSFRAKE